MSKTKGAREEKRFLVIGVQFKLKSMVCDRPRSTTPGGRTGKDSKRKGSWAKKSKEKEESKDYVEGTRRGEVLCLRRLAVFSVIK